MRRSTRVLTSGTEPPHWTGSWNTWWPGGWNIASRFDAVSVAMVAELLGTYLTSELGAIGSPATPPGENPAQD